MSVALAIGPISERKIEPAVRIFLESFSDNVRPLYGDHPKPDAMVDIWAFARGVEPGGFLAACEDAELVGYALFTSSVAKLQLRALTSGRVFLWMLRALAGRYGLRWWTLARQLWNKALFVGSESKFRTKGDAQLLNMAVAPAARGRGIANALVKAGLRYLADRGVEEVRLEVSPHNAPAIAAYRSAGFRERGRLRNIYGEWLVMTSKPSPQ